MPTLIGPFSVGYPVAFRSGGDTTREAFNKHIQEIERIYGILNSLDSGKLTTNDMLSYLNEHKNSTNPHPNWKINLSDLAGNLDGSKITGSLPNATIPAAKVLGNLTGATIDAGKVNGLADFINGLSGGGGDNNNGDGIVESQLNANSGYVKFGNGLIAQWAKGVATTKASNVAYTANLLKSFSSACYIFFAVEGNELSITPSSDGSQHQFVANANKTQITCTSRDYTQDGDNARWTWEYTNPGNISYFAIGV